MKHQMNISHNMIVDNQGNTNGSNIYISTDTYTEQVFCNLCMTVGRKNSIFYEWQGYKRKYIDHTNIIEQDFPHYSIHNEEHSRTIIESVEMFLGK